MAVGTVTKQRREQHDRGQNQTRDVSQKEQRRRGAAQEARAGSCLKTFVCLWSWGLWLWGCPLSLLGRWPVLGRHRKELQATAMWTPRRSPPAMPPRRAPRRPQPSFLASQRGVRCVPSGQAPVCISFSPGVARSPDAVPSPMQPLPPCAPAQFMHLHLGCHFVSAFCPTRLQGS